ncbi:hypothetical protein RF11_03148 [Thelohanellus kitauei]|uniref:Uncharacterized protein n=1 Tax=Thelohanellus kitauei TaxID=669202 RepID=A0A0C2N611_THEKT|nr:hypothetical protein RF11_03148 [Thelohanellus kitauei]
MDDQEYKRHLKTVRLSGKVKKAERDLTKFIVYMNDDPVFVYTLINWESQSDFHNPTDQSQNHLMVLSMINKLNLNWPDCPEIRFSFNTEKWLSFPRQLPKYNVLTTSNEPPSTICLFITSQTPIHSHSSGLYNQRKGAQINWLSVN